MKKRRLSNGRTSGGSVTGGTGDIKPQILTCTTGVADAINQYVIASVALPVPRFGAKAGKATIFEFLWVDWYINLADAVDVATANWAFLSTGNLRATGVTASLDSSTGDALDPRTFAMAFEFYGQTTSGTTRKTYPLRVNLTDSNGNGYLVATDKLIITSGSSGNTVEGEAIAKIAYRLVDVGIEEYVGIVQSQTGTS